MPRVAPKMTERARQLRREATGEERLLWSHIRHLEPRFTRQLPLTGYIVDFGCRTLRIAVELDGSQHLDAAAYDGRQTAALERLGWTVLRFWNSEVRENASGVAEAIAAVVASRNRRMSCPSNSPP